MKPSTIFVCTCHLISFFPKRITATPNTSPKIVMAHGKNGNSSNPALTPAALNSCKEQETK